jgi:hypothetical protein
MSTSPMGASKPIEDIEATLLAATKLALDDFVWSYGVTVTPISRPLVT